MEDMLKDFLLGEHLLLVGNQGVGKNKIVDRFLHLLNRPREYIQLHRSAQLTEVAVDSCLSDHVLTLVIHVHVVSAPCHVSVNNMPYAIKRFVETPPSRR